MRAYPILRIISENGNFSLVSHPHFVEKEIITSQTQEPTPMKPEPIPAIPNLMVLLCIIGGIMRGEASRALAMQFLTIGAIVPQVGWLIHTWMRMEDIADLGEMNLDAPFVGDDAPEGELRAGWLRQDGDTWLWKHVVGGYAVIIPIQMFTGVGRAEFLSRGRVWSPEWVLSPLSETSFLKPVLAASQNCALIVPGS
jgi:hypothetical protein